MQNLKTLSDAELLIRTENLAADERRITTEVLWHLREVERRRLYAVRGFPSLFEYCTRSLGYSEGSAGRRIAAMRLLRDVPGVEAALASGSLNLSHMSAVQMMVQRERKMTGKVFTPVEKKELLESLRGTSKRECEQILADISPASAVQERERVLAGQQVEIRFVARADLMDKFKRIRELSAHRNQDSTWAGLFEVLADIALKKMDPMKKGGTTERARGRRPEKLITLPAESGSPGESHPHPRIRMTVPAAVKRQVWQRDQGRCVYQDRKTGRNCGSRFKLELDHIHAYGKGGGESPENMRLLCREHNVLKAIQDYGPKKMAGFVLV